jgi:hypothetical protein
MKRKAALAAVLFSAAMNINGCTYGPPPDEAVMHANNMNTTAITSEIQEETVPTKTTADNKENKI